MKATTKFMKMFYKLPPEARANLVLDPYGSNPVTISVISCEVRAKTKLSELLLAKLGYKDD